MAHDLSPLVHLSENVILQEDKILAAWQGILPSELRELAHSVSERVKDLLLLMYEYLSSASAQTAEDIHHLAYQIAQRVLEESDYRTVVSFFRDSLQEAVIAYTPLSGEKIPRILSFFNMVTDAYWQAHIDDLRKMIRQQSRQRFGNELRVAKRVQERLLPKVIPQIPGWEFAGRLLAAQEVGGDYWSVRHYPQDGVVTFKLADVTGHGVGAAILVAAVKFISGGFYRGAPSAAWVMERTNHVLVAETPSDIMVTMVYGWLRPESGEVTLVNAGHASAFIYHNGEISAIPPTGPALGVLESRYSEVKRSFEPGDILVLSSDGIIEARSRVPARLTEMFGIERLHDLVCRYSHLSANDLADRILQAAVDFSGTPNDDMSLMIVKRSND